MHPFLFELGQDHHAELLREVELERLVRAARRSAETTGDGSRRPVARGVAVLGAFLIALGTWLQRRSDFVPVDPCADQTPREVMAG